MPTARLTTVKRASKSLASVFIGVLLLSIFTPVIANATTPCYNLDGTGSASDGPTQTTQTTCAGHVAFGSDVVGFYTDAFRGNSAVTSISLSSSVEYIGASAFQNMPQLTSIFIPANGSLTSIGDFAFMDTPLLTTLTLPQGLQTVSPLVFSGANGLTAINVSEPNPYFTSEDGVLFNQDKSILVAYPAAKAGSSYSVPASVTAIGPNAFAYAASITQINLPSTLTSIGDSAFESASSLSSLVIPPSVTSLGASVLYGATSLTSLTLPGNLTTPGDNLFFGLPSLGSIVFSSPSSSFLQIDDVLFNAAGTTLIRYPATKSGGTYQIPAAVTELADGSFSGARYLTSLTIPNSVTSIGSQAFDSTFLLEQVTIGSGIMNSGSFEFESTFEASVTEVIIATGTTSILEDTFFEAAFLESVSIPNSVTSIDASAFQNATSLASITFAPNSQLTAIELDAFRDASALETITIPSTVTIIGDNAFQNATSLSSVVFASNSQLARIGSSAFSGATALTSITIPSSVTDIEPYAFEEATSLASLYFLGDAPTVDPQGEPFYGLPASASAFIQPGATGFGNIDALWNGLIVKRSPYLGAPPIQNQNQNQNQDQVQSAPQVMPVGPVISASVGRIMISANASSFEIVGANMASIISIKVGGKEVKITRRDLEGLVVAFTPSGTGSQDIEIVHTGGVTYLLGFAQVVKPYELTRTVKISQFSGNRPTLAGLRAIDRSYLAGKTANLLSCIATVASDASTSEVALAEVRARTSCQRVINYSKHINSADVQVLKTGKPGSKSLLEVTFDRTLDGK